MLLAFFVSPRLKPTLPCPSDQWSARKATQIESSRGLDAPGLLRAEGPCYFD